MSFTVDGVTFTPDYKSKEKRLYQIITSREREIAELKGILTLQANAISAEMKIAEELREELRALKAKERRRATKRKEGREQPET